MPAGSLFSFLCASSPPSTKDPKIEQAMLNVLNTDATNTMLNNINDDDANSTQSDDSNTTTVMINTNADATWLPGWEA